MDDKSKQKEAVLVPCKNCNKDFERKTGNQKFCTDGCRETFSQKKEAGTSGRDTPQMVKLSNYLSAKYEFRYNQIANRIEYRKTGENDFSDSPKDNLIENLYVELQTKGFKVGQPMISALLRSDFVPAYQPFREYFDKLPKRSGSDPDHINELADYLAQNVTEPERFKLHFKKALVRTVACATRDGAENKHCLTLFGEGQSQGKSGFYQIFMSQQIERLHFRKLRMQQRRGNCPDYQSDCQFGRGRSI